MPIGLPRKEGLYDPSFEKDSCGVGFICGIDGRQDNAIVHKGVAILKRLAHRGAVGSDPETGDGAGMLIQKPHKFFQKSAAEDGIAIPSRAEDYAVGLVFLPRKEDERKACLAILSDACERAGLSFLGSKEVLVNPAAIGETARKTMPYFAYCFVGRAEKVEAGLPFERALYAARKLAENAVRNADISEKEYFHICSLSSRTFVFKGLLMPDQVEEFFVDLKDTDIETAFSIVHSRYSTNTFPSWDLAQPFRYLAHNGEINTLKGNVNWMKAREGLLRCKELFGVGVEELSPILVPGMSDSATLDMMFELLYLSGRPIEHVMMMLLPMAWENYPEGFVDEDVIAFYKYHACLVEPWDGPAAVAFTDGTRIGAVLDRNGLRPARYIITKDNMVVMASEVGVLDSPQGNIAYSGRLLPGQVFFIDTEKQRLVPDTEIKAAVSKKAPYKKWLCKQLIEFDTIPKQKDSVDQFDTDLYRAFGYSREDFRFIIKSMAEKGVEPTHSMGNDIPHAILSKRPQLLYTYFKQLFAQVTNPAIDPIREYVVMNLDTYLGGEKDILSETEGHCHRLFIKHPILRNNELQAIKGLNSKGFHAKVISLLFDARQEGALKERVFAIVEEAKAMVNDGANVIVLSDRGVCRDKAAVPALLAVGAVHHGLVNALLRTKASIIVESAEPREVHHFALLFGYGADCINPYGAFAALGDMCRDGELGLPVEDAVKNYIKAAEKGILKILSKMGISTLRSYRGAQIFEALGIGKELIECAFIGAPSRIGGIGFAELEEETLERHYSGYKFTAPYLHTGGRYQWKKDGEFHLWNPDSIAALQDAVRKEDFGRYLEFAELINNQSRQPTTLRSLLRYKANGGISLDEVEPAKDIVKRFVTGAMSFGSISRGAHESLAIAMNRIGGQSNTGEGGEDPERFKPLPNGDSLRSAIKQVASGRFGVTANYLANADEIQIKIAQGAKPGEGGQLPGHKVSATIAKIRYTTPGVTLISPPPHHDIYSIEDLAQLIFDLKNANPSARISVKLVSEVGVGTVAAGVAKGHADMILISGGDGGTGASPASSIMHAGLPWELGLSETHQTLVLNDLRSRVRLQTDGQMRTGRDVAIAAMLGAEEYGFCTSALVVLGCVMLRHCHLNNCALGVATQDALLERRFQGRPEYVVNYMFFVAEELRRIMASLGIKKVDDLIGRTDLLELDNRLLHKKCMGIDMSAILYRPKVAPSVKTRKAIDQDHGIDDVLDKKIIAVCNEAIEKGSQVRAEFPISNTNRSAGAMLSFEVAKRYGDSGLAEDTIHIKFKGYAGQSFGAFLSKGITFELEGIANDYVGKGLSGGKLIVYPSKDVGYAPSENIIIGNTTFYGSTGGEAYICGRAGERFCIRNSGLFAVVEGVGDHGCEYMTGGRVVVIGQTGINFAAGMSGGIAYVYDEDGLFEKRCNLEMVGLEGLEDEDVEVVHQLLHNHFKYTQSKKAKEILDDFNAAARRFVKVLPFEYKQILLQKKMQEDRGIGIS